ncbi:helix-turn-helix transcriptional regulator [Alloactinosynnema sp. L-07]|uniref:helix-turn-helix domain-containing protein n=1 Tax=Alloactinosynnema sp. L-07 TaxID=1653480 RepID=UPI0009EF0F9D|nr:helix-turn-helix transcriptional regulator [Alloactinosynnema sp. L-07]
MRAKSRAGGRELGALLRRHREKAGLTLDMLSARIGKSTTFLHRLEVGERSATSETEVVHYMVACGSTYQAVDELVRLSKETIHDRGYRLCSSGQFMSDSLRSLVFHEANATRLVNYEPEVIPGLLQTQPYIEALLSREDIPVDRRQERVKDRLERQQILIRNRQAKFTFVIHERALRLEVGDYRIMTDQLYAMMFFADQWNISIRVMPASARHRALFGGSFLYLDHDKYSPMVYLDAALGGFIVEDRDYVEAQRSLLRQIVKVSLNEEESRMFITTLADEYDRAEGYWDDPWQVAQEQL